MVCIVRILEIDEQDGIKCFGPATVYRGTDVFPVGVCGPLPKTLTLFMTKICDFPYPIYDLTKNLIPYL